MKKIFIILSFFVALCSSSVVAFAAGKITPKPLQFEINYGGVMSGHRSMKLENGKIIYSDFMPGKPVRKMTVNPSTKKWVQFRRNLDRLAIWNWRKNYPNELVADGAQWSVVISYKDKSLTSGGSNAYPLANGLSNNSPSSSDHFKAFLRALQDLTGKKL